MTGFVFRHKFLLSYLTLATTALTLELWVALAALVLVAASFSLIFTHGGGR